MAFTLGWSGEDLSSRSIWEMIYPEDIERTRVEATAIAEGKSVSRFVNRWLHRDGGIRWISWAAVAKDGVMFCSGRDITEDKRQEAELQARTAERDRLWTLSQDMFARANLAGMMSAVSPGWTTILGWSERELLTRPYATFMHDDDRDVTLAALAQMGETGLPSRFQNRIATSDGGWKWIEWTVAPELEGQNFIAVGRDLSEVKAREAELSAAQDNLRQSQKMEAVGQLTGGLAHDFNNLLAGISGSLEMMNRRLAQGRLDDIERYISAANQATRRAAALTQRLLAFSRRQTLDPQVVKIDALVDGMLELIYRSVGPEIKVETNHQNGLWSNFVDAGQLENALLNLCINARDSMPNGGIIRIVTEPHHRGR
ncbi:PAS domain S-box protein [Rhizobium rhizoryzae]|uniref:histidine kinase n=1 Tax=Rhizobium rhizoryzae TaxID=451876 RepID=A0A7W6LKB3_9HYPH|nr:PAS domain S-box protein [Rhizobium rhizoryzae]MBB4145667.1 PAS domain S-box-containing protein [Rhizobium rhizoryzae]